MFELRLVAVFTGVVVLGMSPFESKECVPLSGIGSPGDWALSLSLLDLVVFFLHTTAILCSSFNSVRYHQTMFCQTRKPFLFGRDRCPLVERNWVFSC